MEDAIENQAEDQISEERQKTGRRKRKIRSSAPVKKKATRKRRRRKPELTSAEIEDSIFRSVRTSVATITDGEIRRACGLIPLKIAGIAATSDPFEITQLVTNIQSLQAQNDRNRMLAESVHPWAAWISIALHAGRNARHVVTVPAGRFFRESGRRLIIAGRVIATGKTEPQPAMRHNESRTLLFSWWRR